MLGKYLILMKLYYEIWKILLDGLFALLVDDEGFGGFGGFGDVLLRAVEVCLDLEGGLEGLVSSLVELGLSVLFADLEDKFLALGFEVLVFSVVHCGWQLINIMSGDGLNDLRE